MSYQEDSTGKEEVSSKRGEAGCGKTGWDCGEFSWSESEAISEPEGGALEIIEAFCPDPCPPPLPLP